MDFNLFYINVFGPFATLYFLFLIRFSYLFFLNRSKRYFKLCLLTFCAFGMSGISIIMLDLRPLRATQLYALGSFFNYAGYFLYLGMIAKRFNYRDKFARGLVWALGFVSVCIFVIWSLGIFVNPDWFYIAGEKTPANLFLLNSIENYTLRFTPKILSALGTIVVMATSLYLLWRFLRENLKGYQKLVLLGVLTSVVAKLNDFLLATGWGTYLVPLGFMTYFFEILYFQFESSGKSGQEN